MEKGIVKYVSKSGTEVELSFDLIKRYLVHGKAELVTPQEMVLFMGICKERRLNPLSKDCYLIKYTAEDAAAIVTSIDYFRSRARAQTDCRGWSKGIIVKTKSGEIKKSLGLLMDGERLLGGWFKAQPEGWTEPFELELNLSGYIKTRRDGQPTRFWSVENQPSQIAKVAESQGLRTLWPDEFSHVYLEGGEIDHESAPPSSVMEGVASQAAVDEETEAKFWAKVKGKLKKDPSDKQKAEVRKFIDEIIEAHPAMAFTVTGMMNEAILRFEDFWAKFSEWNKGKTESKEEEKSEPEPRSAPDDSEGAPEILEEWSILLQEAELSDAWRGYKAFAGLDSNDKVYEAVAKAEEVGFPTAIKRLGTWWVMVPDSQKKALLEGKAVEMNPSIRTQGERLFT